MQLSHVRCVVCNFYPMTGVVRSGCRRTEGLTCRLERSAVNAELHLGRGFFNKTRGLLPLRAQPVDAYPVIEAEEAIHAAMRLCELLEVSRSGFYKWRKARDGGASPPQPRRADMDAGVAKFHAASDGGYGAPASWMVRISSRRFIAGHDDDRSGCANTGRPGSGHAADGPGYAANSPNSLSATGSSASTTDADATRPSVRSARSTSKTDSLRRHKPPEPASARENQA